MPKSIVLHIGTPKTGTTSIQKSLASAQKSCFAGCYPLVARDFNHNRLVTFYFDHHRLPVQWQQRYPRNDYLYKLTRATYRKMLFNKLAAAPLAIISAEILNRFNLEAALQFRQDLEAAGYSRFFVIMYVRDPADFFLSSFQQALRSPSEKARWAPSLALFKYNFLNIAEAWESAFPGCLTVRSYPSENHEDIAKDFSYFVEDKLNIKLPVREFRENSSLSAEGMKIMQDYRLAFWPNQPMLTSDSRRLALHLRESSAYIRQTKPTLKPELAERIRVNHRKDEEILKAKFKTNFTLKSSKVSSAPLEDRPYRVAELVDHVDADIEHQLLLKMVQLTSIRPAGIDFAERLYRMSKRYTAG